MDFRFGEKEQQLRRDLREFVKQELPRGYIGGLLEDEHYDDEWEFSMKMSRKLAERGWLTMNWPKEYGGLGASYFEVLVYAEEAGYWWIPGTTMGMSGVGCVGPSLIRFGSEEQRKKYLPPISAGDNEGIWCTGYSEPDAGSDFANIRTRADKKGDEYIINGQKVWTSFAHRANWCWLAAKTQPDAKKKHQGISLFIVDMRSKGITVRPIHNYVGFHIFNEVFFDDVSVPAENLVGVENQGWSQLMQSLMYERGTLSLGVYGAFKRIFEELLNYAKESDLLKKSVIRQKLADVAVDLETLKMLAYETVWKMSNDTIPIYEPSRDKAFADMLMGKLSTAGTEIIGACSQMDPLDREFKWAKLQSCIEKLYWIYPGVAIAGGTTDTQRNIIAQFGLELSRSY